MTRVAGRLAGALRGVRVRVLGCHGQATIELVALVPVTFMLACAGYALLATMRASEIAAHAAHNGARAMLQQRDGAAAAKASLPAGDRDRAAVRVAGDRITVVVEPRLPLRIGRRLSVPASAHAGAAP